MITLSECGLDRKAVTVEVGRFIPVADSFKFIPVSSFQFLGGVLE